MKSFLNPLRPLKELYTFLKCFLIEFIRLHVANNGHMRAVYCNCITSKQKEFFLWISIFHVLGIQLLFYCFAFCKIIFLFIDFILFIHDHLNTRLRCFNIRRVAKNLIIILFGFDFRFLLEETSFRCSCFGGLSNLWRHSYLRLITFSSIRIYKYRINVLRSYLALGWFTLINNIVCLDFYAMSLQ